MLHRSTGFRENHFGSSGIIVCLFFKVDAVAPPIATGATGKICDGPIAKNHP